MSRIIEQAITEIQDYITEHYQIDSQIDVLHDPREADPSHPPAVDLCYADGTIVRVTVELLVTPIKL